MARDLEARLDDGDLFGFFELPLPELHFLVTGGADGKLVEAMLGDFHRQLELRRGAVPGLRLALFRLLLALFLRWLRGCHFHRRQFEGGLGGLHSLEFGDSGG